MRTLRLLLAAGLSLAPTLAATAAGTTPAFAGGGAGMTLTATMEGQDQRLLAGTKHVVHITLADTPGEADLRDISISLTDLEPTPLPVTCPDEHAPNGDMALEPNQSLQCTAVVTAAVGHQTLVVQATAVAPGLGSLFRTTPLHYDGFMPPPPPQPAPVHDVLPPSPAAGRPQPPVSIAPPVPPHFDQPKPVDAPSPPAPSGCVGAGDSGSDCCAGAAGSSAGGKCCGSAAGSACCGSAAASTCCGSGHLAAGGENCCGSTGESGSCAKHHGLAFTGMSTPMLATTAGGGLLLVAGGLLLVKRFARR